jgi:hypothetical protein
MRKHTVDMNGVEFATADLLDMVVTFLRTNIEVMRFVNVGGRGFTIEIGAENALLARPVPPDSIVRQEDQ